MMEDTAAFFDLNNLQDLQRYEGDTLENVHYYIWFNPGKERDEPNVRFLYAVELVFEEAGSLLLRAGDQQPCIEIIEAGVLVEKAEQVRQLHEKIIIHQHVAAAFPLWELAVGERLEAILLSNDGTGRYYNDAMVFSFPSVAILLDLHKSEGLAVSRTEV